MEDSNQNAEERKKAEKKRKKEALEAEKETNELKQKLKDAKNVKQLKQVIMAFLDNAERRLNIAAKEFEDTESFVKGIEDAYGSDSEQTRKIAQKNASGSFVHTVSALQKNVIEAWKKITVILKPKALPGKVLEEVMADEEEKKINREAERRKRAVVQEKDAEIAALKRKLEEERKKYKVRLSGLEARLHQQDSVIKEQRKQHKRMKTEADSLIHNRTGTSEVRNGKSRDEGRFSTPYQTSEARRNENYTEDSSWGYSVSYSKTLLKDFANSDLSLEKYNESAMKSDKTFEGLDKEQRISFTGQKNDAGFLGSISETKDDTSENILDSEWSDLQKEGRQLMTNLTAYLSKKEKITELTWDNDLMDQVIAWKKQAEEIFLNIGKNNRMPIAEPKLDKKTIKLPSTPKVIKKTKTEPRLLKTEKKSGVLKRNLDTDFVNEQSGVKLKQPVYKKIDNRKFTNKEAKRK